MKFKNTKKQGDWGLGVAIAYFTSLGKNVSIPLTDSQVYDLVVEDKENIFLSIQVKTTTFKIGNHYYVSLSTKGGNRSSKGCVKPFKNSVDYLFIITSNFRYLIPCDRKMPKHGFKLSKKYTKYKVS